MTDHSTRLRVPEFKKAMVAAALSCGAAMLSGCTSNGAAGVMIAQRLTVTADRLPASLETALYFHEARGESWCIISDLSPEEILAGDFDSGQFVRIEWLWTPRPGSTPMDRDATNVSIRHIVIAENEVGVFEGGGFALPTSTVGGKEWGIELRNATLSLVASTSRFHDQLSPARLTGSFTARLELHEAQQVRNAISQRLTNLFNRSMRAHADQATKHHRTKLGTIRF